MATTAELREQRCKLIEDARTIVTQADEQQRGLSAEEREQYDKLFDKATTLGEATGLS